MIKVAPRQLLTRAEYFALHGPPIGETTALMLRNADRTIARVNATLVLAWDDGVDVGIDQVSGNPFASGRRPPGVNAATANAAAASTHLTCEGGDVQDLDDRRFAVWLCRNTERLAAIGLWMEDPRWTGGRTNTDPWAHLQTRAPRSGRRIYVPSTDPPTDPRFFERFGLALPG